ncbi:hypothetical protein ACIOYV_11475 [Pseudomonas sp. NPDC087342]|uniref:hypothetical protein n=1 Tax=Pseudomonas sp. NPDC087342 TaxID=3364437 RepID=UPI0038299E22
MKIILGLMLSVATGVAFALPAAEQELPQVKSNQSSYSKTLAADGADRTPQGRMA